MLNDGVHICSGADNVGQFWRQQGLKFFSFDVGILASVRKSILGLPGFRLCSGHCNNTIYGVCRNNIYCS